MADRFYLLTGNESVLRDEALRKIRAAVFGDASQADLNEHRFEAGEDPLTAMLGQARTLPFLASARLILVYEIEELEPEEAQSLLEAFDGGFPHAVWVLICGEKFSRSRFLKELEARCRVIPCGAPYREEDFREFIRGRFAKEKCRVDSDAAAAILDRVGKDLSALALAVERLALWVGPEGRVRQAEVLALLGDDAEQNAFELYDALKNRRIQQAFRIYQSLRFQGKRSHEILGSLAWQFHRMLRVRNLLFLGLGPQDVAARIGMKPFAADKAVQRVRGIKEEEWRRDLKSLSRCDRLVKGGGLRDDLAVEHCLIEMAEPFAPAEE